MHDVNFAFRRESVAVAESASASESIRARFACSLGAFQVNEMESYGEMDALEQSAREMMMMSEQGETILDSMLSRANRVTARIESMYKYSKILQEMQGLTVYGNRRELILDDLQRENKQIMALQDENRQLRETTEEYLSTMRDILESHADLETGILLQEKGREIDDIDNIVFEMANAQLEDSLKEKALNMQKMMDGLEILRKQENQELALAVQRNKNYKEMFKLACFSSPSAIRVLQTAMNTIMETTNSAEEESENEELDDLNKTIIRQS